MYRGLSIAMFDHQSGTQWKLDVQQACGNLQHLWDYPLPSQGFWGAPMFAGEIPLCIYIYTYVYIYVHI